MMPCPAKDLWGMHALYLLAAACALLAQLPPACEYLPAHSPQMGAYVLA
jgi:hypothetical protein